MTREGMLPFLDESTARMLPLDAGHRGRRAMGGAHGAVPRAILCESGFNLWETSTRRQ